MKEVVNIKIYSLETESFLLKNNDYTEDFAIEK